MKDVCIIVPLYNEEDYVYDTITALKTIPVAKHIVAVDDGSRDSTYNIIKNIDDIKIIKHDKNMGKAQSIIDGIKSFSADIYVFVDGDLGECARNIYSLISEILNDRCDVAIANFPHVKGTGGIGALRYFSKLMVKFLTGVDCPSPLSGQRALKKEVILNTKVKSYKGYGIEVGMLVDALAMGYKVKFIDLDLTHRVTKGDIEGYLHRFRQSMDIMNVFLQKLMGW